MRYELILTTQRAFLPLSMTSTTYCLWMYYFPGNNFGLISSNLCSAWRTWKGLNSGKSGFPMKGLTKSNLFMTAAIVGKAKLKKIYERSHHEVHKYTWSQLHSKDLDWWKYTLAEPDSERIQYGFIIWEGIWCLGAFNTNSFFRDDFGRFGHIYKKLYLEWIL